MKNILKILLLCTLAPLLVQCSKARVVNQPLPEREIVFQLDPYYSGGLDNRIGFLDADGSNVIYLEYDGIQAVVNPIRDRNGDLYFSNPSSYIEGITQPGTRIDFRDYWALDFNLINGNNSFLLVSNENGKYALKELNIESGKVVNTFFVGEYLIDDSTEGFNLGTNSFYNNQIVYQRHKFDRSDLLIHELRIYDKNTDISEILLRYEGTPETVQRIVNPAFSPDGTWIAYTSNDGIYLIRPDGSDNHIIIRHEIKNFFEWPPTVSWSPDGSWIVYHKCLLPDNIQCRNNVEDSSIYKYNIESAEEILLLDGGVNPYWQLSE